MLQYPESEWRTGLCYPLSGLPETLLRARSQMRADRPVLAQQLAQAVLWHGPESHHGE